MVVLSFKVLRAFGEKYPNVSDALRSWYSIAEKADWANFHEMKSTFNSVDSVGNDRYVFNVKGNHCRLVVLINFGNRTMYILFVGTHSEYSKIDASTIKFKKK